MFCEGSSRKRARLEKHETDIVVAGDDAVVARDDAVVAPGPAQ